MSGSRQYGTFKARDLIAPRRSLRRSARRPQRLPVTESLIVDAALSLRLNAEAGTGADLYAEDLSDRRLALIQEWDRLHAARGVAPPPAPTVRSLRLDQEDAALGLLASVLVGEELERRPPGIAGPDPEPMGRTTTRPSLSARRFTTSAFRLRDMPAPNTSVQAYEFEERPGGKGLNQAVGLARQGAKVRLISPLGSDQAGDRNSRIPAHRRRRYGLP